MSHKAVKGEHSPSDYKRERELRGTQQEVADALGVLRQTISLRERKGPIPREAWLALRSLPIKSSETAP
jgi:hypothetical protein